MVPVAAGVDEGGDGDDEHKGQGHHQGFHPPVGGQHHSRQAEHGADAVEDGHGLLLAEAHVDEPVMDVPPVRLHGVLPVADPAQDGKDGVEKGQGQHQEGEQEGDDGVGLEHADDGHGGQHITQQQGPRIPGKDLGRVEVIGDEAQAGARQGRHDDGHVPFADQQGDHQHSHASDAADPHGQTVQPVDQVDGIGHQNDPEDGDGHAEPAQDQPALGKQVGVGEDLDADAVAHGDAGGDQLQDELRPPLEGVDVVNDPGGHHHHAAQQHAPHLDVDLGEDQGRQQKAQEHGQAAQTGDGMVVHPPPVLGHVHGAHLLGEDLHQRCGGEAHHQGGRQGGQGRHQQPDVNGCRHTLLHFAALTAPRNRLSYRLSAGCGWRRKPLYPRLPGRRRSGNPCSSSGPRPSPGWAAAAPPRSRPPWS